MSITLILPATIIFMDTAERIFKSIRDLKVQGAREVAKSGLQDLALTAWASGARTKKAFFSEMGREARRISKARSEEPAMINALNYIITRLRFSDLDSVEALRKATLIECRDYLDWLDAMMEKIAENGAALISTGDVVMTHCHSHEAVAVLRKAKEQGKVFKAIVTETRPMLQGMETAKDLRSAGIGVVYCVDSAMGSMMKQSTKVLVGADAIMPDGSVMNKIGTFPIAVMARQFGRPFLVAGDTVKFTDVIPEIRDRPAKEVADPGSIRGISIANPPFDITPSEFVSEIITEQGVMKPGTIRKGATVR